MLVIRPSSRLGRSDLRELWEKRELLYFLAWRDVKVRYKQTVFGVAWAVLQPLAFALLFALIFGRLLKAPSQAKPYVLLVLAGLIPWQMFAAALTRASTSLVGSYELLTKVYFPRLLLPIASVLASLVEFVLALLVLGGLMAVYGVVPPAQVVLLPLLVTLALVAALAAGILLAALNVKYRDVQAALPFLTQVWLFATPIAYSADLIPRRYETFYALNPIVGVVEGFRWVLLGTGQPGRALALSCGVSLLLLLVGLAYFRHAEREFADVV